MLAREYENATASGDPDGARTWRPRVLAFTSASCCSRLTASVERSAHRADKEIRTHTRAAILATIRDSEGAKITWAPERREGEGEKGNIKSGERAGGKRRVKLLY